MSQYRMFATSTALKIFQPNSFLANGNDSLEKRSPPEIFGAKGHKQLCRNSARMSKKSLRVSTKPAESEYKDSHRTHDWALLLPMSKISKILSGRAQFFPLCPATSMFQNFVYLRTVLNWPTFSAVIRQEEGKQLFRENCSFLCPFLRFYFSPFVTEDKVSQDFPPPHRAFIPWKKKYYAPLVVTTKKEDNAAGIMLSAFFVVLPPTRSNRTLEWTMEQWPEVIFVPWFLRPVHSVDVFTDSESS